MSSIKFIFLWSDLLLFAVFLIAVLWILHALRSSELRTSMKSISKNRNAMFSLIILSAFIFIALVDSIHFREISKEYPEGTGAISLFDKIVTNSILGKKEKTYSAPLALKQFTLESKFIDSKMVRLHPRLKHIPPNIKSKKSLSRDILKKLGFALFFSLFPALIFILLINKFFKNSQSKDRLRKRFIYITSVSAVALFIMLSVAQIAYNYHLFGTNKTGQDVFYAALKSIRTGIIIGTLTTLVVTPLAILLGALAGYLGGKIDDVVQYIYTTLSSIPDILLIAASMLILRAKLYSIELETIYSSDLQLLSLCAILGITSWTGLCRLVRGEVLSLKNQDYIRAADALGVSRFKILLRHLIPNVMHIVLINIILRFSGLVLAESVLAYVGIGVDPSMHSWGNMINNARLELARDPGVWWNLLAAFIFMFGLVLPANIFGDAVRDALDPRLRGSNNG